MVERGRRSALFGALLLAASACGHQSDQRPQPLAPPGASDRATLRGSGSTFVEPLLREWIGRYAAVAPDVKIDYEAIGSPAAVDRLTSGERGDFFASDVTLTDVEEVTLGGSDEILQVPWAAGAIAIAYNLPDVPALRLSADTVAGIFAGRVVRWDDPAIRGDNEGVRLPSQAITVVSRSDPSGTTAVFSSFLDAAAGGSWGLGTGDEILFPRGQGARGSDGVAAAVKRTAGAVGYVELGYARRAGLGVAQLGNHAGRFVAPTTEAVNAALISATLRDFGTTAKLLFTPDAPGAYPLATFSYLLVRRNGAEDAKLRALRHFAAWAMSEGQRYAEPLGYAPVPRQFVVPALTAVDRE